MSTAEYGSTAEHEGDVTVLEEQFMEQKSVGPIELESQDVSVWFGQRKVLEGVTTVTEVLRVSGSGAVLKARAV